MNISLPNASSLATIWQHITSLWDSKIDCISGAGMHCCDLRMTSLTLYLNDECMSGIRRGATRTISALILIHTWSFEELLYFWQSLQVLAIALQSPGQTRVHWKGTPDSMRLCWRRWMSFQWHACRIETDRFKPSPLPLWSQKTRSFSMLPGPLAWYQGTTCVDPCEVSLDKIALAAWLSKQFCRLSW